MADGKIGALRDLLVFKLLSAEELEAVGAVSVEKVYKAGTQLFSKGEEGDTMYVIVSGSVKIMSEKEDELKDIITLSAGDFFGEIALFERVARTASAITLEDCILLEIDRDEFGSLISQKPHLGIKILYRIIQEMGKRLQRMNQED